VSDFIFRVGRRWGDDPVQVFSVGVKRITDKTVVPVKRSEVTRFALRIPIAEACFSAREAFNVFLANARREAAKHRREAERHEADIAEAEALMRTEGGAA